MAATVDTGDLVSAKTISVRLGLSWPSRVHELVERQSDPMPGHVVAQPRIHLWLWSQIRGWAADNHGYHVVEPGDWVDGSLIQSRLGLNPEDIDAGQRIQADGQVEWAWGDAEQAWISEQMNVHGGN